MTTLYLAYDFFINFLTLWQNSSYRHPHPLRNFRLLDPPLPMRIYIVHPWEGGGGGAYGYFLEPHIGRLFITSQLSPHTLDCLNYILSLGSDVMATCAKLLSLIFILLFCFLNSVNSGNEDKPLETKIELPKRCRLR